MKYDPSTYIGIGNDGFRGPDPYDPFYDEIEKLEGPVSSKGVRNSAIVTRLVILAIFGFVGLMLSYFFFFA
jgi:hypothetical protein